MNYTLDRFWGSTVLGDNGCILWARTKANGYGKFKLSHSVKVWAHRWILEQTLGALYDPKLWALHRCDVKLCVNPEHLYQGTARDNYNDMIGRGREAPGARAKLTEDQVREIRTVYAERRKGYKALAKIYGVSAHGIKDVVTGKTWKHVV